MRPVETPFVGDPFRWIICASLTLVIILLGIIIGRKNILVGLGGTMMFVVFIGIGYLVYMSVKHARPQVGDWIGGKNFIWVIFAVYGGMFLIGLLLQCLEHVLDRWKTARAHNTSLAYEMGWTHVDPHFRENNARRAMENNSKLREQMRLSNEEFQRSTDLANQQAQRDMEQAQRDFDNFNNNNFNNNNGFPF